MPNLQPIHFDLGNVDINIEPPSNLPSIANALINNTAFPPDAFSDGAISLGSIKASASRDFPLDKVTFLKSASVGGGISAGMGVYRSTSKLFDELKAEDLAEMVAGLVFPNIATEDIYAIRWGYDASGSISGSVALGVGISLSFGASGSHSKLYAVLRSLDRSTKSIDALKTTVNSWKMPRQVDAPDQLEAGTWLIAETDGKLDLSLGVEYGYEYNWVRDNLTFNGLTGDLGLKIHAGISAKFGFQASGRYATVLCRESDAKKLRLQVFKMRQQGWSSAFDAALTAQATSVPLPKDFYDFVKGIFNLNGLQALKDIQTWLDPAANLNDLIGAKTIDEMIKLVKNITGVTPADINAALNTLRKPIEFWHALPHKIASLLYDLLKKILPSELAELRGILQEIRDLSAPGGAEDKLKNLLAEQLRRFAFFTTPIGKWLTAVADDGILSLITSLHLDDERTKLNNLAKQTLALINGDLIEKTITDLQKWIEQKLNLDKIINLASQADFDSLDEWLKKRLSAFIGQTAGFEQMKQIRDSINKFLEKNQIKDFYDKGYKALTEKYQAEINYTFQKTTSDTALIDLTFDFDANSANAKRLLKLALNGDFNEALSSPTNIDGLIINQAALTHEIKRHSHLEVNLPFFKASLDHINEATVANNIVQENNGRLWIFNLTAEDVVSKKDSISKLSVAVHLTEKTKIRVFEKSDYKYNYQLRFVKEDADSESLRKRLKILSEKYFPTEFASGNQTFNQYLATLDRALDAQGIIGPDIFGTVLSEFNLSLPGEVLTAWKKSPTDKKDQKYFSIARRVQENLRNWIPLVYIQNLKQYDQLQMIYPLLVYTALPTIGKIVRNGDQVQITLGSDLYNWDYQDSILRQTVMEKLCPQNLPPILARVRQTLSSNPGRQNDYADTKINQMFIESQKLNAKEFVLLVKREDKIINGVMKTAKAFLKFLAADNIDKAAEELANFGRFVTSTFNNDFGGEYSGDNLRPLASLLMIEIAGILDNDLIGKLQPNAMLELMVLKPDSQFAIDKFLIGDRPESKELEIHQSIVRIGRSDI